MNRTLKSTKWPSKGLNLSVVLIVPDLPSTVSDSHLGALGVNKDTTDTGDL